MRINQKERYYFTKEEGNDGRKKKNGACFIRTVAWKGRKHGVRGGTVYSTG